MRTPDYWEGRLTDVPSTIECVEMRLLSGHDHEPPIFVGPGYINIRSSTDVDFTMFATPANSGDAIRRFVRAHENQYEVLDQFCLFATDYQGTEWACGWTQPELKGIPKVGWPLTGKLNSLVTYASGPWVSTESGVELVFRPKLWLPMEKVENWLSEPLRILLGQLVFPRLVARNFGDGTAQVWLRPSPPYLRKTGIASLVGGEPVGSGTEFWALYASLLTLIAEAREEEGHPNFKPHRITRFYEEIIQATQGSRWVLCMTLASVAEGLAKMLMRPEDQESDFIRKDIESLKTTVARWEGDSELRGRILSDIANAGKRSIGKYLRDLVQRGILEKNNERAWSIVRNAVMHGNLVSPWATEEEDKRLLDLAELVHRLTRELIREGAE